MHCERCRRENCIYEELLNERVDVNNYVLNVDTEVGITKLARGFRRFFFFRDAITYLNCYHICT